MKSNKNPLELLEYRKYNVPLTPEMFNEINAYSDSNKVSDIKRSRLLFFLGSTLEMHFYIGSNVKFGKSGDSIVNVFDESELKDLSNTLVDIGILKKVSDESFALIPKYNKPSIKLFTIYIEDTIHDYACAFKTKMGIENDSDNSFINRYTQSLLNDFNNKESN